MSIATVAHKNNVGIYGAALAHTDWTPDADATAPNAGGNFTVTGAGGTLTLDIPNKYEDRLGVQVPALTGPDPVPEAYITRQSGYYAPPWLPNPEGPEGVYCWLGWGYLYVSLTAPAPTTVTATVTFYGVDTHSDTHVTDASRQTDYGFATGDLSTLEYETPIAAGAQTICIDLATEVPLRIVKSVKLEFGAVGAWTLAEPLLCQDAGDAQAAPPRAGEADHLFFKEFEHFAYKRGGMSACVDGQYYEAIAWPDDSHENTLEPTGGHFDYRISAGEAGLDLSSAWTLLQFLSLIERTSDAWDTTYDNAAAEAAFKDEDDAWLKTPDCFDLRPVNRQTGTAFDVAVRVGQWTTAAGLHYDFTAEKIVEGQAHGWAQTGSGKRVRSRNGIENLWRRTGEGVWHQVDSMGSDGHGHWHSSSHEIVAEYDGGTATLWDYGTGHTAVAVTTTGRWAVREYDVAAISPGLANPHLRRDAAGRVWLVYEDGGNIAVAVRSSSQEDWQSRSNAFAEGDHTEPTIAPMPDGSLIVSATRGGGGTELRVSRDDGDEWAGVDVG